jgi:hypothetical protein
LGFAGVAVTSTFAARAQQPMRRIGVLMSYPESDPQGQLRAKVFRRELEKARAGNVFIRSGIEACAMMKLPGE